MDIVFTNLVKEKAINFFLLYNFSIIFAEVTPLWILQIKINQLNTESDGFQVDEVINNPTPYPHYYHFT